MVEALVSHAASNQTVSAYKARDVVNAPVIKERIKARSAERGDSPEIAAWLTNHFTRHVIGNVQADAPAVQRIDSGRELQDLMGRKEPPAWAQERLAKKASGFDLPDLWR